MPQPQPHLAPSARLRSRQIPSASASSLASASQMDSASTSRKRRRTGSPVTAIKQEDIEDDLQEDNDTVKQEPSKRETKSASAKGSDNTTASSTRTQCTTVKEETSAAAEDDASHQSTSRRPRRAAAKDAEAAIHASITKRQPLFQSRSDHTKTQSNKRISTSRRTYIKQEPQSNIETENDNHDPKPELSRAKIKAKTEAKLEQSNSQSSLAKPLKSANSTKTKAKVKRSKPLTNNIAWSLMHRSANTLWLHPSLRSNQHSTYNHHASFHQLTSSRENQLAKKDAISTSAAHDLMVKSYTDLVPRNEVKVTLLHDRIDVLQVMDESNSSQVQQHSSYSRALGPVVACGLKSGRVVIWAAPSRLHHVSWYDEPTQTLHKETVGGQLNQYDSHDRRITELQWSNSRDSIVSSSLDGNCYETSICKDTFGHKELVCQSVDANVMQTCCILETSGSVIACGDATGQLFVRDLRQPRTQLAVNLKLHHKRLSTIKRSPANEFQVLTASNIHREGLGPAATIFDRRMWGSKTSSSTKQSLCAPLVCVEFPRVVKYLNYNTSGSAFLSVCLDDILRVHSTALGDESGQRLTRSLELQTPAAKRQKQLADQASSSSKRVKGAQAAARAISARSSMKLTDPLLVCADQNCRLRSSHYNSTGIWIADLKPAFHPNNDNLFVTGNVRAHSVSIYDVSRNVCSATIASDSIQSVQALGAFAPMRFGGNLLTSSYGKVFLWSRRDEAQEGDTAGENQRQQQLEDAQLNANSSMSVQ